MIQVLHINSNYLTSKLHENLLDRLENEYIHNMVFMPIKDETKGNFLYESKYEVYHPVSFRDVDKFVFKFKQRKIYKKLHEIVNINNIDMVHAHTLFTDGNIAYQLNKDYGIPYIVVVRGFTDIDNFFKKRFNLRKHGLAILNNASKVIFLSETNRQELIDNYIKSNILKREIFNKSIIIPNGIDDYYFENQGAPKKIDISNPIKFLQVGQVRERKNGLGSVRGIREFINKTGNKAELLFVGKIIEKNYAKKLKEEGKGVVKFHPPVNIEKLISIYRENDIFIMPSFSETFGLVYPEAMSQGLPVIYTKGQGFDGQYKDGYVGYPVIANNSHDIAEKIKSIIDNYEVLSKNALEAYGRYNWDVLAKNYLNIYSELLNIN